MRKFADKVYRVLKVQGEEGALHKAYNLGQNQHGILTNQTTPETDRLWSFFHPFINNNDND